MQSIDYQKENHVKQFAKRTAEAAVAGGVIASGSYVTQNGFELSEASVIGLLSAAGWAVYGVLVRKLGELNRPTIVK